MRAFSDARRPPSGEPDEIGSAGSCDDVWATIVGHDSRRSSSTAGVGGTGNRTLASIAEGHQGEMKFFHGAFMVSYPVGPEPSLTLSIHFVAGDCARDLKIPPLARNDIAGPAKPMHFHP